MTLHQCLNATLTASRDEQSEVCTLSTKDTLWIFWEPLLSFKQICLISFFDQTYLFVNQLLLTGL